MGAGAAGTGHPDDRPRAVPDGPAAAIGREAEQAARQRAAALAADDIDVIAIGYPDVSGVVRVKAVPTGRLGHAARHGVGMSPVFDVFTSDDAITASAHLSGPDGDLRLRPDLDRLTPLAAQPGWAWAPADRFDQRGAPHPGCARHLLRRTTAAARGRGLRIAMGFETEWVLLRDAAAGADAAAEAASGGDAGSGPGAGTARDATGAGPDGTAPVPAAVGPAYGMTRLVAVSDVLRDVVRALRAQDIDVWQIHPEYAPGQFEVSTAPGGPLAAADDVVLVRETIRAVSARHGMTACFAPAVLAGEVGNGCHLHLSLHEETAPRDEPAGGDRLRGGRGPHGLTRSGEAFLAGVLDELPALLALGAPSPAGYLRLAPSRWAGAYRCWGLENREAALRLVAGADGDPGGAHAELKCFDAAANPYLLAAGVIAAGLAGLDSGARLPDPVRGDPAETAPGTERLPRTLTEATDRFEASAVLRGALGETLHGAVVAVRRAEEERLAGRDPRDVAAATRRRY